MNHSRWNLLPPVPDRYLASSGLPPLLIQLLYNRGLTEPAQIESFLSGDRSLCGDPFLLPDMHRAVARTYQALLSGETIAIYGDYDVDGVTATAILAKGLAALGSKVIPYIPHRLTEGYGLTVTALENLRQQGVSLVITVDCGITSVPQVKRARRMGLDIIITDHHTPLAELPPAIATVNPRLPGSTYPFTELAGAGVAFKLLQALLLSLGKEDQLDSLVDLVALGTIADVSPLVGENRYLVRAGLKSINTCPRPGIREIITQAALNGGSIDSERISWVVVPRLNAAGRLAHALTSYNLLMTESAQEAHELAAWLEQKNAERQKLTTAGVTKAKAQVLSQGISPLLLASDKDYHAGITGLIAGRLAEEFYRPAVVIKTGERFSSGSCRSIPEFNIIAALSQCRHLLSQFGGHSQAAGFTTPTRNLARLEQHLSRLAAEQLAAVDLRPCLNIDALVRLPDLGGATFQIAQRLTPFGRGNPMPVFLSRRVEVNERRTMGNNNEHLRLRLKQGGTVWEAVAFRLGDRLAEVCSPLDVVYNLEVDRWGGEERLRLNIIDFATAE